MSDLTALSGEYAENAEFVRTLNSALLALRKRQLAGKRKASGAVNFRSLGDLIAELARCIDQKEGVGEGCEAVEIPRDVLDRLRERHRSDLGWYAKDLQAIGELLRQEKSLSDKQLRQLDEICEAADAAATAVFRRLWRR